MQNAGIAQSLATVMVVGQKPHSPLAESTRQAKPEAAMRGCCGSPFRYPQVDTAELICLLMNGEWSGRGGIVV